MSVQLATLIRENQPCVVLTGAGVSTNAVAPEPLWLLTGWDVSFGSAPVPSALHAARPGLDPRDR